MTAARRYRLALVLAMSVAFVVVTLLAAVWPLIGGVSPPGVSPDQNLATVSVRNTDGRPGFRASAVESLVGFPGIRSIYYGRATAFNFAYQDRQLEAITVMVNDHYFRSLGVKLRGPGFSRFAPWQRNLQRECVLSSVFHQNLAGATNSSLLGKDIDVRSQTCRVVGIVDSRFEGMRPPRRVGVWMSWPSIIGLNVPDIAPDEFLDPEQRVIELGIVLERQVSLSVLETAVSERLRQASPEVGEVRLLAGDGMEPGPRHRLLKEVRLILLAVGVLLAVILVFVMSYSLWYSESARNSQAVHVALGATAPRLIRRAAWFGILQVSASLLLGSIMALLGWSWLLAGTSVGDEYFQMPRTLPARAILLGGAVILVLGICTWISEIRIWLRADRSQLAPALRRFREHARIETVTAGILVAAIMAASLLAAWILADFQALRATPRGYEATDIALIRFTPETPKSYLQFPIQTRRGHSVDSVLLTLSDWLGHERAAVSSAAPFMGFTPGEKITPRNATGSQSSIHMPHNMVSRNFFQLYGIPFLEGGTFSSRSAHEVILSESAALRLLGERPWLGQALSLDIDFGGPPRRVAGVIANVAYNGRNSTSFDMFYTPLQAMDRAQIVSIGGGGDLGGAGEVLARLGITDKLDAPVLLRDMESVDNQSGLIRTAALMTACLLAIVLGGIGLTEMLLVSASRRMPEFALRLALGATLRRLAWSLFHSQLPALFGGLLIGTTGFALAAHYLVARGFSVEPPDLMSLVYAVSAMLALLFMATIPSLINLRRIPTAVLLKQD